MGYDIIRFNLMFMDFHCLEGEFIIFYCLKGSKQGWRSQTNLLFNNFGASGRGGSIRSQTPKLMILKNI